MRYQTLFLSALLLIWVAGASYWYVCKVRGDCCEAAAIATEITGNDDETTPPTPEEIMQEAVSEAAAYLTASGIQKGYFPFASATGEMSSISSEYLEKLRLVIENNSSARVEVTGHADNIGPDEYNRELGLRRAEYVKAFLAEAGVAPDRIVTSTRGSSEPAQTNSTAEGRAANRRSEIKVII